MSKNNAIYNLFKNLNPNSVKADDNEKLNQALDGLDSFLHGRDNDLGGLLIDNKQLLIDANVSEALFLDQDKNSILNVAAKGMDIDGQRNIAEIKNMAALQWARASIINNKIDDETLELIVDAFEKKDSNMVRELIKKCDQFGEHAELISKLPDSELKIIFKEADKKVNENYPYPHESKNNAIYRLLKNLKPENQAEERTEQKEMLKAYLNAGDSIVDLRTAVINSKSLFYAQEDRESVFQDPKNNNAFLNRKALGLDKGGNPRDTDIQKMATFKLAMIYLEDISDDMLKKIADVDVDVDVSHVRRIISNKKLFEGHSGQIVRLSDDDIRNFIKRAKEIRAEKEHIKEGKLEEYSEQFRWPNEFIKANFDNILESAEVGIGDHMLQVNNFTRYFKSLKTIRGEIVKLDPTADKSVVDDVPSMLEVEVKEDADDNDSEENSNPVAALLTKVDKSIKERKQQLEGQRDKLLAVASSKLEEIKNLNGAAPLIFRHIEQAKKLVTEITQIHDLIDAGGVDTTKIAKIKKEAEEAKRSLDIRFACESVNAQIQTLSGLKNHILKLKIITEDEKNTYKNYADPIYKGTDDDNKKYCIQSMIKSAQEKIKQIKSESNNELTEEDNKLIKEFEEKIKTAKDDYAAIINRVAMGANTYIALSNRLSTYFLEPVIIKKGTDDENPPNADDVAVDFDNRAQIEGAQHVHRYQKIQLEEGDKVLVTAGFEGPGGQPRKVATLELDSRGKVTNTTAKDIQLTDEEEALMALKQAEMMLNNYKPSYGDLVVTGGANNVKRGATVYAALLYLKDKNPKFDHIKISTTVPGGDVPEAGWGRKKKAREDFINEKFLRKLPQHKVAAELIKGDVTKVVEKKIERTKEFKVRMDEAKVARNKATAIEGVEINFTTNEGEEVNLEQLGPPRKPQ